MAERVPLTTLLSWVWVAHTMEIDNATEEARSEKVKHHFRTSLTMWANGLRLIEDDGLTVDELRRRAGAACNLPGLERWGWITLGVGPDRRDGFGTSRNLKGDTLVRLSRAGAYACRIWPRTVDTVEARWRQRFGDAAIGALGSALRAVDPSMPWSPPEVHPSDGFWTQVMEDRSVEGDPPLAGLLGQALTAFTLAYEREATLSLPLAANMLRVIGADQVRVRDLPLRSGVSKEAVAMAVRFLEQRYVATKLAGPALQLTPAGLRIRDSYLVRSTEGANPTLREALEQIVARPGALAEGLVPPASCWRAAPPYLTQTKRLLHDPCGALPWQPMVLHRGGWPDGC
jgi:hypothetical protein